MRVLRDQAVADYLFLVKRLRHDPEEAVVELLGWGKVERVAPMRRYAESLA